MHWTSEVQTCMFSAIICEEHKQTLYMNFRKGSRRLYRARHNQEVPAIVRSVKEAWVVKI